MPTRVARTYRPPEEVGAAGRFGAAWQAMTGAQAANENRAPDVA